MSRTVAVLDLETTGVDVETARIVSAYVGLLGADGTEFFGYEWLVRPDGFEIPTEATAIHGITTERALAEGFPLSDVLTGIAGFIQSSCIHSDFPLAGMNIAYDLTILDREDRRAGVGFTFSGALVQVNVLDALVLDRYLVPKRRGTGARRLIRLAEAYGVTLSEDEAHGASADAIAAGRIVQKQLNHHKLSLMTLREIHNRQRGWKRSQAAELQAWFRANGRPDEVVRGEWPFIPRAKEAA